MSGNVEVKSGGILLPMLAVLLIGLKLTGYIQWGWLWVLSPLWIPLAVAIVIIAILIGMKAVLK